VGDRYQEAQGDAEEPEPRQREFSYHLWRNRALPRS
jgi:hypothetical protein